MKRVHNVITVLCCSFVNKVLEDKRNKGNKKIIFVFNDLLQFGSFLSFDYRMDSMTDVTVAFISCRVGGLEAEIKNAAKNKLHYHNSNFICSI